MLQATANTIPYTWKDILKAMLILQATTNTITPT